MFIHHTKKCIQYFSSSSCEFWKIERRETYTDQQICIASFCSSLGAHVSSLSHSNNMYFKRIIYLSIKKLNILIMSVEEIFLSLKKNICIFVGPNKCFMFPPVNVILNIKFDCIRYCHYWMSVIGVYIILYIHQNYYIVFEFYNVILLSIRLLNIEGF